MPQVVFMSTGAGPSVPPLAAEAPEGGSLGDLCDDVSAPIPFSCRSATCGTCRIVVLEGGELLLPPEADELSVLAIFASAVANPGASAGAPFASPALQRLACQAKMRPGPGRVLLRPVADDEP